MNVPEEGEVSEHSLLMMADDKPIREETASGSSATIHITRPAYNHDSFIAEFGPQSEPEQPWKSKIARKLKKKYACTGKCMKDRILSTLPFINMFRTYQWRNWLLSDVIAGLSVGVIHIPQGMGFAVLTNLPPVYGLYASIFPVWFYFLLGTSKHISVGTMALISLMIGAVVKTQSDSIFAQNPVPLGNLTANDSSREEYEENIKVGIAMSASLLMGAFQFVMWLLHLDILSKFMSMSFNQSFMTGAACHIITSQVSSMFGLNFERPLGTFSVPLTYYEVFRNIKDTNVSALLTAVISIVFLLVIKICVNDRFNKRMIAPIPTELLLVVIATIISHYGKLNEKFGLKIVGHIPTGLPAPRVPPMTNASEYIVDGIILAILGFVISLSLAKIVSKRQGYSIDPSQEILAYSIQNGISAFFLSFGGTQAPPRTLVCEATSGKTQLAGLISSILPLLVCLALAPLFNSLPYSVLAAIIVVALLPLLKQFSELPSLWRASKVDFFVWVVTVVITVIFSIPLGLIAGIGINLLLVVVQSMLVTGRIKIHTTHPDLLTAITPEKQTKTSTLIYELGSSLYYVNVEFFKEKLMKSIEKAKMTSEQAAHVTNGEVVALNEIQVKGTKEETEACDEQSIKNVILLFSAVTFIDLMGVNLIKQLNGDFKKKGITLALVGCQEGVRERLMVGAPDGKSPPQIFPTVQDAVSVLQSNVDSSHL